VLTAFSRITILASLLLVTSCSQDATEANVEAASSGLGSAPKLTLMSGPVDSSRWYSSNQLELGAQIFADKCSDCHGQRAQGRFDDWKQKLPDGSFPPPPLNGTAHAWHHPLSVLLGVINQGGIAYGGKMPGFETSLNEQDKLAVIAYFQDFWSTQTYDNWLQMGGTN
jgi:mono/diheme cytochrome c family protein